MLKSRFTKPLAIIALLSVLPVLAQSQGGSPAVPPPPGPYTALPAVHQLHPAPRVQTTPASQVWSAPQGQAMPYWMRTSSGNAPPAPRNGVPTTAPTTGAQYSPQGWATTPETANIQPNRAAFGMGPNSGFFPNFGQPNGGFYQGVQGYGYQGYPQQMQMPYWNGPTAPYYPGFGPAYPAYGQYNR